MCIIALGTDTPTVDLSIAASTKTGSNSTRVFVNITIVLASKAHGTCSGTPTKEYNLLRLHTLCDVAAVTAVRMNGIVSTDYTVLSTRQGHLQRASGVFGGQGVAPAPNAGPIVEIPIELFGSSKAYDISVALDLV